MVAGEGPRRAPFTWFKTLGARVVVQGSDYDDAKIAAIEFASEHGELFVEDRQERAISEGAGTIGFELCQSLTRLDCVLLPLGGGAQAAGVGNSLKAHSPSTGVIGVCATGAPVNGAVVGGGVVMQIQTISTIADGIAFGIPNQHAVDDVRAVVDEVLEVDDDALVAAMKEVFAHHRLVKEPAGAAGVQQSFRTGTGSAVAVRRLPCAAQILRRIKPGSGYRRPTIQRFVGPPRRRARMMKVAYGQPLMRGTMSSIIINVG